MAPIAELKSSLLNYTAKVAGVELLPKFHQYERF